MEDAIKKVGVTGNNEVVLISEGLLTEHKIFDTQPHNDERRSFI